eukprot:TRINITY_DN4244_c0_g1_i1.p1 TRINITY_DN4244_c0_g1~~TRINITY_DN4244_c0_g1_i1.p1  ORF type:complete len:227 (+),score=7.78 TRINITY_DN4244_c0_g1_i1:446-1126(+)
MVSFSYSFSMAGTSKKAKIHTWEYTEDTRVTYEISCIPAYVFILLISVAVLATILAYGYGCPVQYLEIILYKKLKIDTVIITQLQGQSVSSLGNIYDSNDLFSSEDEAMTIVLAFRSFEQSRGNCSNNYGTQCSTNSDCIPNFFDGTSYQNGTCNTTTGTCVVSNWCPIEEESAPFTVLSNVGNLTINIETYAYYGGDKERFTNNYHYTLNELLKDFSFDSWNKGG